MIEQLRSVVLVGLCVLLVGSAMAKEDCALPENVSGMTLEELKAEEARIGSVLEEKLARKKQLEGQLRKVDWFSRYRERGYAKRTGSGDCVAAAQKLSDAKNQFEPVHKRYKKLVDSGRATEADAVQYKTIRVDYVKARGEYTTCMDKAIRADEKFRELLDEDPGAAKFARENPLYSFAAASARYEELKAELAPAGQNEFAVSAYMQKLNKDIEGLDECVNDLQRINNAIAVLKSKKVENR